jgi:CheY-like chemotaxis protein
MLLPKLAGQDVLRALKNNPKTSFIPVIVLSSLPQGNEQKLKKESRRKNLWVSGGLSVEVD